jgi:hypothetical protein
MRTTKHGAEEFTPDRVTVEVTNGIPGAAVVHGWTTTGRGHRSARARVWHPFDRRFPEAEFGWPEWLRVAADHASTLVSKADFAAHVLAEPIEGDWGAPDDSEQHD